MSCDSEVFPPLSAVPALLVRWSYLRADPPPFTGLQAWITTWMTAFETALNQTDFYAAVTPYINATSFMDYFFIQELTCARWRGGEKGGGSRCF